MKDQIFSVGYRRLPGPRSRTWPGWAIARTAWAQALRKRSTKLAGGLCVMVFLSTAIVLVTQVILKRAVSGMSEGIEGMLVEGAVHQIVGGTHETLSSFIATQMYATTILLGIVGGGLVAEDRRTGAFELYFSRPLSQLDYILGKWLAAALVPVATVVVPLVILWIAAVGVAPPEVGSKMTGLLVPALGAALLVVVLLSTTILGISSVGSRGRTVAVIYVVGLLMLSAVAAGLYEAGYTWAAYLSPQRNIQTVADALLGVGGVSLGTAYLDMRQSTNPSALASAGALLSLSLLGALAFVARVRAEVNK